MLPYFSKESLFGKGFDYDYIHVEPCLTTAACSAIAVPQSKARTDSVKSLPSIINDIAPAVEQSVT